MSNIERFVYKTTGKNSNEIGNIVMLECDLNSLIATRPMTNIELLQKRRKASPRIPEGISIDGQEILLIDGHHKAINTEGQNIICKVFVTNDPKIIKKLEKRKQIPISELRIAQKKNGRKEVKLK